MTDKELYALNPMAWVQAKELLAEEAELIKQGASKETRHEHLERRLEMLVDNSAVGIPEGVEIILAEYSRKDLVVDINEMARRFERQGFTGTARETRNRNRRLGIQDAGIDPVLFVVGCNSLPDNDEITDDLRSLFGSFFEALATHPLVEAAEPVYKEIMQSHELLSVRHKKSQALASELFNRILTETPEVVDTIKSDDRALARVRGAVLDLPIAVLIRDLVLQTPREELARYLAAHTESIRQTYIGVLTAVVQPRLDSLRGIESPKAENTTETNDDTPKEIARPSPASGDDELLTENQAIKYLNVSRSTINRLAGQKMITKLKVGNSNRYSKRDLDDYLGRK